MQSTLPFSPKAFLLGFIFTFLIVGNTFAKLRVVQDTIPQALLSEPDQYVSLGPKMSLAVGITSLAVVLVNNVLSFEGILENAYAVYSMGIAAGLAAIVLGITGLVSRARVRKANPPGLDKRKLVKAKRRSLTGILLGFLGIIFSVLLILAQSGMIGFSA
ncbi:hypothetical protein [Dyadobacter aurulentus]|uniref:hypothetical protein n=1 Tax=Dyadobacter sp. UC 10 TaxID=2605428 RepID=UPI0011F0E116|nr:hypothetical protein [Dyadobacter sp. UC 10]KAA0991849.1 hypothetical protein FXO21_17565 [Dyadobacter sp. UC 10]